MNKKQQISNYINIKVNKVWLDGKIVFTDKAESGFEEFLKNTYRNFEIKYPKFFKMDNLSKLAFISAELLLRENNLTEKYKPEEIALIFSCASSSLNSDKKYHDTIKNKENYFPSPAVFVYTLPNIMVGEICIRHKITGENYCLISQRFSPELLTCYTQLLGGSNKASALILGWVDVAPDCDAYEAFVCIVENEYEINNKKFVKFETCLLNKLYQITE